MRSIVVTDHDVIGQPGQIASRKWARAPAGWDFGSTCAGVTPLACRSVTPADAPSPGAPGPGNRRTLDEGTVVAVTVSRYHLPGTYLRWAHNGLVRVTVTRIEWDGTMQRRMVDTAQRADGP